MKERPILFSAPMVRSLLNCTKSQTRRVVKPQPAIHWVVPGEVSCLYGQPGDRLWVREGFSGPHYQSKTKPKDWNDSDPIWYWADGNPESGNWTKPKPSIHMPRWASRILLEVTGVRVERLKDISEADAIAEGAAPYLLPVNPSREGLRHVDGFAALWESINGAGAWDANPWVWVIAFKRVTP